MKILENSDKKIEETVGLDKKIKQYPNEIIFDIEDYDFIFSDFDPRPFNQRSLSDDFLIELKKASNKKEEPITLKFLLPSSLRDLKTESTIKKRLNNHFSKHLKEKKEEKKRMIKEGVFLVLIGIFFMFIATFLIFSRKSTFFYSFLIVLLEPAGWFSFWEGLYILVFKLREKSPELEFYEKMKKANIIFESY